ncbi:hypothetical protein BGZ91_004596 [Linnemannia elongata]|nr:hypothetical protein BGZ91_004596 [Linnemannia elongata]KAG0063392.1 hypothetical protein BGZ90_002685 [Linnemannia elongata]
MGLLDTVCIATNPGVTGFYGLAFAQGYGPNNVKPEYAILVRSNTNPESSTNITWTTISMFDSSKLAGYPNAAKGVDYSCAYNEQGVFTMFGRAERGSSSVMTKVPFGLRYDPNGSMDPSFNYQGTGAWMNLTVGEGHTWSGGFTRFSLGYAKTGATKVLVHASISDTNNVVSLATVNDSTGTLAVTALWTMKPDVAYVGEVTIRLTIRDPNTAINQGIAQKGSATLIDMDFSVPIGDWRELGPSAFALLKNQGTIYACGIGNYKGFRYNHTASQVIVAESYGIDLNPPPPPAAPTPTILSRGGIIGIVFGAIALAALTFFMGRRTSSRSKKKDADEIAESDAENSQSSQTLDDDKDDPQIQEPKDGANFYDFEGKYLISSHPDRSRTPSTEILPMASIAPVPQYIQEQFQALHDQMRILQEQFYSSQFSNHPRPTYVTTASYVGEPAAAEPSDPKQQYAEVATDDSALGQPIQFTPPPRRVDSRGMPSPSALAYDNVVHQVQPFPQDSQSVAPQESLNSSEIEVPTPTPHSTAEFGLYPPQS